MAAALRTLGRVEEANNLARAHTTPRHAQGGASAAAAARRRSRNLSHMGAASNGMNAAAGPRFPSRSQSRATSFENYQEATERNKPPNERYHSNTAHNTENWRGYGSS